MRRSASFTLCASALFAAASDVRRSAAPRDFTWVRGVNYVPSTAHNDVATWQDYDAALVEAELGYAASAGFNAVRVFLSTLPWLYDAAAFRQRLAHFVATLAALNMTSQLVLFDSCFGNETADLTWITSGRYRNATWIPSPGPAIIADEAAWPLYDAYIRDVVQTVGARTAVAVFDLHNEPNFALPNIIGFINHTAAVLAAADAQSRPRTVGVASSAQQGLVQDIVTLLSFHNYNGGGGGADLARDIAGQRALAEQLGKPLLLTEAMSRPSDLLTSVLPAVFSCFGGGGGGGGGGSTAVGWFVWELMLGVDQFNADWTAPYQGLLWPAWAPPPAAGGGAWRYDAERALLADFFANGSAACPPPGTPFVPDTSPAWGWAPTDLWTAWAGAGPPQGTLHYASAGGAVASVDASALPDGAAATALVLVHKRGPDCGLLSLAVNGAVLLPGYDSYAPAVDWAAELRVPLPAPPASWVLDVTATGRRNASSSNSYVQIVGLRVEFAHSG